MMITPVSKFIEEEHKILKSVTDSDQICSALFILKHEYDPESTFKNYFNFLPKDYSNYPTFFKDKEIQYLQGSYVMNYLDTWNSQYKDEFNIIQEHLPFYKKFSIEEYKKARNLVWSRTFSLIINDVNYCGMGPIIDLCNFDPRKINSFWEYNENLKALTLTAERDIVEGEEVNLFFNILKLILDYFKLWCK